MRMEDLAAGDLLFRFRGETEFSDAVSSVIRGWRGLPVHHVGIYDGQGGIWEAGVAGVRRASVASWTGGVLGGRLAPRWRAEFPQLPERLLEWVSAREGLPYNDAFDQAKRSYYCSELVVDAFQAAGVPLFATAPLTFRDPSTGQLLAYWERYYAERGKPVPEGAPGSHPATLSLSPELTVDIV